MGLISRFDFTRGWVPSADAVHAPQGSLLRADNLVLDERGTLALRDGSSKINGSAFADTDVHSLFTVALSGTRYRMAGASNKVYANGAALSPTMAGSGDTSFGSYLGHILFARSTSKHKYDGTTVRNWGIAAPNGAPTLAITSQDGKTFITGDSTESPALAWTEDDGTGASYTAGFEGTANGAAILNPNAGTGRGRLTKTFAAPVDFTTYDAAQTGLDSDTIGMYVYVTEPQFVSHIMIQFDIYDGVFQRNQYYHIWWFLDGDGNPLVDSVPLTVGWNFLSIPRGAMTRNDSADPGKNWSTVKAVRFEVQCTIGAATSQIRLDLLRIRGGSSSPLTGIQKYKLVAVYNSGTYLGKSAPGPASAEIEVTSQGTVLTIAGAVVGALDSQVNELWAYRSNEFLGGYYRVAVKTGGPWVGDQTLNDTLSDADALSLDLALEGSNTTPPDSIIGIAGPHYDRVFCLTATSVYPSQNLNIDSFDSTQVLKVGDSSETALWITKVQEELYVGTTKDIYRLVGDWTVRASDGLLNVSKVPMGTAYPPISSAFTQDENSLIYLAADGWHVLGSFPLNYSDVDLLYRGKTRHGVSPVNLTSGRFKCAVAGRWFSALTPEGGSTTTTSVIHRFAPTAFPGGRWYRHTYTPSWRCLYREPDGTLIASDNAGFVWVLDTGTQDAGPDIPVVLWTPVEDDGKPNIRKDGWDFRIRANTGGTTAIVGIHRDGASSSADSFSINPSTLAPVAQSWDGTTPFTQIQLRVTGSFSTFLWYDYHIAYRDRAPILIFAEPKPEARGTRRKRYTGLTVTLDSLGAVATVTPVLDDVELTAQSVTTSDVVSTPLTFANVVGRDLWCKIAKATGFEYYGMEPIVVAEFPPIMRGRVPDSNGGTPKPKVVTGIRIRGCTLGAARTFTPIVDGTSLSTFSATTETDDPDEIVHSFSSPQIATDVAWSVDGNFEIYDWAPIVDHVLPLGRKLWDTGPIELGPRVAWASLAILKARLTADLTVTPYVNDVALTALTVEAEVGVTTSYDIRLPRPMRGRVLRYVISSTGLFYPYWLRPRYRITGNETELQEVVLNPNE